MLFASKTAPGETPPINPRDPVVSTNGEIPHTPGPRNTGVVYDPQNPTREIIPDVPRAATDSSATPSGLSPFHIVAIGFTALMVGLIGYGLVAAKR